MGLKSKLKKLYQIKDIAEFNPENIGDNYPFLDIQYIDTSSVTEGKLTKIQRFNLKNAPSRAKRLVKENDILISTVRPNLKHYYFVKDASENLIASTGFVVIRSTNVHPLYLYYFLITPTFIEYIVRIADSHTSAYPSFLSEIIENYEIKLPSKSIQNRISKILYDLDCKITNLQNQNRILEQIAQTIFKSWFVDFDGQTEFVDSELGKIPKGWIIKELDKIAIFVNGLPLQKFRPTTNNYLPVIKIREMKNGFSDNTEKAKNDLDKKYVVENGDVLFSWSGTLELMMWYNEKGALNQHIFKVISEEYEKWFCYEWIRFHLPKFRRIAEGKVTTMGHIQRHHLSEALVLIPLSEVLEKMNIIMNPIFKILLSNNMLIQNLIKIRDILLPKLMSGKIRVK